MVKYICDRCKEEMDECISADININDRYVVPIYNDQNEFNICHTCLEELKIFLRSK